MLQAERIDPPITILNGIAAAGLGAYLPQSTTATAFFKGQIDEVSLYQRALTSNEVAAIYGAGSTGKSLPTLRVQSAAPGSITLSWDSTVGRSYQLQSATNLPASTWFSEGAAFPGTGGVLLTNLPIRPGPAWFFRLKSDN